MSDDRLEQALNEETVSAIQATPFAKISSQTPVHEAVKQLADMHVACLLVEEEGKLVGVFSHRDVLNKIALEYNETRDRPVYELMTNNPIYVHETDSPAAALAVMAAAGFRHVPILATDETIAGIASPHRVTEFLQQYLVEPGRPRRPEPC